MKKQFFYATMALSGLMAAGCGCSKADNLAVVDGSPITMAQYHSALEHMSNVKVTTSTDQPPTDARVWASLGFQALQALIQQQLLLEVAKDEGVTPNATDITNDLNYHVKQQPTFVSALNGEGLTLDEIKDSLRLELATYNILTKGITVTAAEAKKFITSNPQVFSAPEQAQLLFIVVPDAKTKDLADKELASGQSFGQVAMHYSIATDARQTGGKYKEVGVSRMPPQLQDLVHNTSELKTTDWIKDREQWVKFYVEKKTAAKPMPVDDALVETVRRQMAMQKGRQAVNLQKLVADKMRSAKIQVVPTYLATPWNTYAKQVSDALAAAANRNPPAGATAPAPGGAAPGASAPAPKH